MADSEGVVAKVGEAAGGCQRPQGVLQVVQQLQSQAEQGQLGLPGGQEGGA